MTENSYVYLDNAATTFPKPDCVTQAVVQAMQVYGANPGRSGHRLSIQTAQQVFRCRETIAGLFGLSNPEQVVFTSNCTQSLNMAIKGILRPGDHVLVSDLEHNSVMRPLQALHSRRGVQFDIFPVFEGDPARTVQACQRRIRHNTRLIACTHASNVFGIKLPVRELAALAKRHKILFLLDAAQTAGCEEIRFEDWGIDLLAAPGHKGLYGPSGTGILLVRQGLRLGSLLEGGTGSSSLDYRQPQSMPDHLESGTVNTAGIIGLNAAVDYLSQQGREQLLNHEMRLTQMAYEKLSGLPGVELYTQYPTAGTHAPLFSFNIRGISSEDAVGLLDARGFALRGGLHCAPGAHKKMGTVQDGACRMSLGIFNTEPQILDFCEAVKNISQHPEKTL